MKPFIKHTKRLIALLSLRFIEIIPVRQMPCCSQWMMMHMYLKRKTSQKARIEKRDRVHPVIHQNDSDGPGKREGKKKKKGHHANQKTLYGLENMISAP